DAPHSVLPLARFHSAAVHQRTGHDALLRRRDGRALGGPARHPPVPEPGRGIRSLGAEGDAEGLLPERGLHLRRRRGPRGLHGSVPMTIGQTITLEDLERDPYPIYERLRAEEPVSWVPAVQLWLVTRWDDVYFVDHRPEMFTAATDPSTLNRTMGVNMLGSEGPDHRRIRSVVESPFRPREVEARTGGRLTAMADELIDGFAGHGSCDLFRPFCEPLSVL